MPFCQVAPHRHSLTVALVVIWLGLVSGFTRTTIPGAVTCNNNQLTRKCKFDNSASPTPWTSFMFPAKRTLATLQASSEAEDEAAALRAKAAELREEVAADEIALGREPKAEPTPDAEAPSGEVVEESMPKIGVVSSSMKEKLRNELRSQGADPNVSAGNPILIISLVIVVLVILGGKDILY